MPAHASPASAHAALAAADDVAPLCQLEGGRSFAVDTGAGEQPSDYVVYPELSAGDRADVTIIPCWDSASTPDQWITSLSVTLGDDNVLVGQATGLHTVDPVTLELNGHESIPSAVALTPMTVRATDSHGVERWSATVSIELVPPCTGDFPLAMDTGIVHDAYVPQLEGGSARVTVIPCPGTTSSDTWITSVTASVFDGGEHDNREPVAELAGLHATEAFPIDLHSNDGMAFPAGQNRLSIDVTDNHGVVSSISRYIWIVDPVSASWLVGSTLPNTETTVRAELSNTSSSPVTSVSFQHDAWQVQGEPTPVDFDATTSSAQTSMTFVPSGNRIWAYVTLADGITYPLAPYDVDARYTVETSVQVPDDTSWGAVTAFHAQSVSTVGTVQRGLKLHLQSRSPGSTRWVDRATAVTDGHGRATLAVRAATTGTAAWRVTSSKSVTRHASTSATHVVQVHALFGRLPATGSVHAGHVIRYPVVITPASARARVDVQVRRAGHATWTTLGYTTSGPTAAVAIRPRLAGQYTVRYVVESTKTLARTVSRGWSLHVIR